MEEFFIMKKLLALLLVLALSFSLVACSQDTPEEETTDGEGTTEQTTDGEDTEGEDMPEGKYMLGVGISTSTWGIQEGIDTEDGTGPKAQIDTTVAAVLFDPEGTIVSVDIDVAQQAVQYDSEFNVTQEADLRTKIEKGPDYGMLPASPIEKEYDAQIEALEAWLVGKTIHEVSDMELGDNMEPTSPDLTASVTVDVSTYIAVIQEAYTSVVFLDDMPAMVGLGMEVKPTYTEVDTGSDVEILTYITVAAFDADGKIMAALFDEAQQTVMFDAEGMLDGEIDLRTKMEKGDDYGMLPASPIGVEFDDQILALQDWVVGKTAQEATDLSSTDTDLHASVSVFLDYNMMTLLEAYEDAK